MTKSLWSGRILFRYALFQLPGWVVFLLTLLVVRHFVSIPLWLMILLLFVWIIKDAAMYPFVWRAYDKSTADSVVGMRGTATDDLNPSGYLAVRGELWKAEIISGNPPVTAGETVLITGTRGLTLIVKRDTESNNR